MEGKRRPGLTRGTAGIASVMLAASTIIMIMYAPVSAAAGAGAIQGRSRPLAVGSNYSSTSSTATQNSTPPGPNPGFSCGFNTQNSSQMVASSPADAEVRVMVGEPSWLQVCTSDGNSGESFPAYEVFPVTVYATPGTPLELSIGRASHTPQQIAMGLGNNTIWTGFDPVNVTTDAEGIARSNFTLAGAVMPFVPNDVANVSFPIIARSPNGAQAAAGLPIEFSGSEVGGIDVIHVLATPGPILFPGTMQGSAGSPVQYAYGIVYAPPSSNVTPIQVTLSVAGSWNDGAEGLTPSGVEVTVTRPTFVLYPDQVMYFFVDENNSVPRSTIPSTSNYTFAIRENVGGSTFIEPLSLSVSTYGVFGSFGAFGTNAPGAKVGSSAGSELYVELAVAGVAAIAAVAITALCLHRKKPGPIKEGTTGEAATRRKIRPRHGNDTNHRREVKMRRRAVGAVVVILAAGFFFIAPVVHYNNLAQHAGHVEKYESLSCALFDVGVSYGYPSFLANDMVLTASCGMSSG